MDEEKTELTRRQFMKGLAVGSLSFLHGCSEKSSSPTGLVYERSTPSTTKIALYKTQDRKEGVKKVMELLEFSPVQGKHVILKPNFNTADPPPASTHNDTLRQLVLELQDRGASEITVAERSYQWFNSVIAQKGIDKLSEELNFNILNLESASKTRYHRNSYHWENGFSFPDRLRDAEYIVATCCLKTHHSGPFTMSLKLSVGTIPFSHMDELHGSGDMRKMIAEINSAYKPDLIVMDGVLTFIEGGPSTGTVKNGDVMVAGTDRIAVDAVGVAILKDLGSSRVGGEIFLQEQIKRAVELKLGIESPGKIEFVTPDEPSREYAERLQSILADG